mmetsp:Transcript_59491/g.169167  ORF Transcript_59491/g.169167 Transcript_59491/m.169167 type:complete len:110 (+) Transcript_59491:1-330(+)
MICNIPCRLAYQELVSRLAACGLGGRYDYLHLPMANRNDSNLGYAFINLSSAEDADWCTACFAGCRFEGFSGSSKVCAVKPARLQGAAPNMLQFGPRSRRKALAAPRWQ